ncbi:M23 family metallopeptidase [Tessaracoccus sp. OH4464_COT-324]|uniref:M23 family metallopeptidase n=1 Tax=Tessaracoccus sp. OH4464_COT-324 TaxID=2491059 RepID=UPI000F63BE9B|nr:M23 family metallopeptidase [Tessaracoccus sp. OH4464_COT-324]RRD47435.1 hypothetical protein EII42_02265 [Tessaracoccus sp. OH4464_COT-324]
MSRELPLRRMVAGIRSTLAALLAGAVIATAPLATADDLDDERKRVDQELGQLDDQQKELQDQVAQQRQEVAEANQRNIQAVDALKKAQEKLSRAEENLRSAERQEREARELDDQRARELSQAEDELRVAREELNKAVQAYNDLSRRIDQEVSLITQQNGPLMNFALLLTETDAAELNYTAQMGATLFDLSAQELDEAERLRFRMEEAERAATEAEDAARTAKSAAEEQLKKRQAATRKADSLRREVSALVSEKDQAAKLAADALADEEANARAMEDEQAAVAERIKSRMARADELDQQIQERNRKREEERKAREAAAKKAAEEEAARKAAEAEKRSKAERAKTNPEHAKAPAPAKPAAPVAAPAPSSALLRPVNGRLTSPFGMRRHPVTGIVKLHDGTDFGASCGTPIRAAADGVVAEKYFNRGYGNRLMIDHGRIQGKFITTGYNHATHYTVDKGEHVERGQVIGYVGSTGYSTGCHLHLMVWENGGVVDPMRRWF